MLLLLDFSCKTTEDAESKCLPASILIVYLGKIDEPVFPLLIRTDSKDTSYLKFLKDIPEKYNKHGMDITSNSDYLRMAIINDDIYAVIKKYILSGNTHENENYHTADQGSFKIVLSDKCDLCMYSIGRENKDFFANLAKLLPIDANSDLIEKIKALNDLPSDFRDGRIML